MKQIDDCIRAGRLGEARLLLKDLIRGKVPRGDKARLANFAWRAGVPLWGLRLLNPLVRPGPKKPVIATDEEKAEYAACLTRVGASEEATALLEGLPAKGPQVLLYRVFARVARWEYAATLEPLQRYVQWPGLEPYQVLVGRANLAAALVFERRLGEALDVIGDLIEATRRGAYGLLLGAALDLRAEAFLAERRWDEAERALDEAERILGESESLGAFFVRKWRAVLAYGRAPGKAGEILHRVRREAVGLGHWETVRFCDRSEAIWGRKPDLFRHVFVGTPFEGFRQWMLTDWGEPFALPESHRWSPGEKGGGETLDVLHGTWRGRRVLKPGALLHRLLLALTSDFYRPLRLATLHHRLYPGDYFSPVSSPPRIYDAVQRFRKWAEGGRIPFAIEESGGAYRLSASAGASVEVPFERGEGPLRLRLEEVRRAFGSKPFSWREAAALLRTPERTTRRLLSEAKREGWLGGEGKGPATRYRFIEKKAG